MTKPRFASLTAGLLARKGEAAPPVALFNKAPAAPESPAQFDDVSPEMQERIDSIVESPNAPSNWTHPPENPEPAPSSLDLETEYGMDDQRTEESLARAHQAGGLLSKSAQALARASDSTLFSRVTPTVLPKFGRRKDDNKSEPSSVIVSLQPKKNQQQKPEENDQDEEKGQNDEEGRTLIVSRARAPSARRTAITLRLDEARYLRLKYAGASLGKTSQAILEAALDEYLVSLGEEFTHDAAWLRRTVSIVSKPRKP